MWRTQERWLDSNSWCPGILCVHFGLLECIVHPLQTVQGRSREIASVGLLGCCLLMSSIRLNNTSYLVWTPDNWAGWGRVLYTRRELCDFTRGMCSCPACGCGSDWSLMSFQPLGSFGMASTCACTRLSSHR